MTFPVVDLVSVRRTVSFEAIQPSATKPARMIIVGENAGSVPIYLPYAPPEVDHGGIGGDYSLINRPGLPDVTTFVAAQVPQMSFTLLVVDKAFTPTSKFQRGYNVVTAMSVIRGLTKYASEGTRVRITYGTLESGLWYITSVSLSSIRRDPRTDEIIQAEVDLSLTKASDVVEGVGPVTGGVRPPAPPPAPAPPQKTSSRYYTMKKGDTLYALSVRFYGTGSKWRAIADANGITNTRNIPVGKVLRIP